VKYVLIAAPPRNSRSRVRWFVRPAPPTLPPIDLSGIDFGTFFRL
jgi:hypothetical protein